jgi:hypothetical protein
VSHLLCTLSYAFNVVTAVPGKSSCCCACFVRMTHVSSCAAPLLKQTEFWHFAADSGFTLEQLPFSEILVHCL